MRNEKGQVIIIILGAMILFLIFIPALVYYVQQEAKWTEKQRMTSAAFHLAEAGIDRGYWKLKEKSEYWDQLSQGKPISNYNFDLAYEDVPSTGSPLGKYTIQITTHPTNKKWRIIRAIGLDASTREKRAIELILERQGADSSLYSENTISLSGNAVVHWGPMRSEQNITATADYFPRKISKQQVVGRPLNPNPDPDEEYWHYYTGTLGSTGINDSSYTARAFEQPYCTHVNTDTYNYYTHEATQRLQGMECNHQRVWYYTSNLSIRGGTYIYGTLIVRGNLDFTGTSSAGSYTITPPQQAWEEYKKIDTVAANEYYADAGGGPPSTISSSFQFGATGNPDKKDATKDNVTIRGFVYVGGNLSVNGNVIIHGAIIVKGTVSGSGNLTIFYDDNLGVEMTDAPIVRKSWKEVILDWPTGF